MNITIKTTGHELSLGAQQLIEEKFTSLGRLVSYAADTAVLACEIDESIAVERAGAKYQAKGNLSVDGHIFHAEAQSMTLEGAVDLVRDQLAREVQGASGKKRGLLRRGGVALKKMLRLNR